MTSPEGVALLSTAVQWAATGDPAAPYRAEVGAHTWTIRVNDAPGMLPMSQALTPLVQPDLYELFALHAAVRGTPAPRERAEAVFAFDGTFTPFDIGVILAEYL